MPLRRTSSGENSREDGFSGVVFYSRQLNLLPTDDHVFLPPLEDEEGPITDSDRDDFFQVWSKGVHYRRIAFESIAMFEHLKAKTD
jgi:hypothetical protein